MNGLKARRRKALVLLGEMKKCVDSSQTMLASMRRKPFEVLISTILSQRSRDETTIKVSRALFAKYKTPREIAGAPLNDLQKIIHAIGFFREKAKRIKEVCRLLVERHESKVPRKLGDLLALPGVGRKTANCVLVYAFGIAAIPSDTHVHRISNLFGLVKTKTAEKTEEELEKVFPKNAWLEVNETFVLFGKQVCKPGMSKAKCLLAMKNKGCRTTGL